MIKIVIASQIPTGILDMHWPSSIYSDTKSCSAKYFSKLAPASPQNLLQNKRSFFFLWSSTKRPLNKDFSISCRGTRAPKSMCQWSEQLWRRELLRVVDETWYRKPSLIQMTAIPLGLLQRDVIGILLLEAHTSRPTWF